MNLKQIEKEVDNAEINIRKELKEKLLNLSEKDLKKYFEKLIDNYYNVAFTFEDDPSKYHDESKKKYKLINEVKSILASSYNNLDNYERFISLNKVEDIAFNQMMDLHFMEKSYSNIIYHEKAQELFFINETLTDLINIYRRDHSEIILSLIEDTLKRTTILIKNAKKLPLYDSIEEITKQVTFRKEHYTGTEEFNEDFEVTVYTNSVLSLWLKEQLNIFEDILKQLEEILPEGILEEYEYNLNYPEELASLDIMLKLKSEDQTEEEIHKTVALMKYMQEKDNKGYLYEIL